MDQPVRVPLRRRAVQMFAAVWPWAPTPSARALLSIESVDRLGERF